MPRSSAQRLGDLLRRGTGELTERDWERSVQLEPRLASADPELVSDGIGLPFPPSALAAPSGGLPEDDAAVQALIAILARRTQTGDGSGAPTLTGWRMLARTDGEALFGHGQPPRLVTIALRRAGRRHRWKSVAVTRDAPLRTTREGVRASGWRLDPETALAREDTVLRVLVTEQTRSGGMRADTRLLAPDVHLGPEEIVLTMFVTPRGGYQTASAKLETPVRVVLPEPIGERDLCDGALLDLE